MDLYDRSPGPSPEDHSAPDDRNVPDDHGVPGDHGTPGDHGMPGDRSVRVADGAPEVHGGRGLQGVDRAPRPHRRRRMAMVAGGVAAAAVI